MKKVAKFAIGGKSGVILNWEQDKRQGDQDWQVEIENENCLL
jgi:hypothetical protein